MYEKFYDLSEKPFSILPDPDFVYWSSSHSMAHAMLEYGVLNRAGFTVITGDIGTGKTTLIRHLIKKLGTEITVGLVSNTRPDSSELIKWILMAFGQTFSDGSYVTNYQQLQNYLIEQNNKGNRTVLIIDEAQNLDVDSIEELRMLSNINADKNQILQLILVGQPQLRDLVRNPELKQFAQRVASDFHLHPLDYENGNRYINHRLAVAGGKKELFTREACQLITDACQGIPRLINILCDTSLIYGLALEAQLITPDIVRHVLEDKAKFGVFSENDIADVSVLDEHRKKQKTIV